jgi:hypothetical protein
MVEAIFEHEGNAGFLKITTHFGRLVAIACEKHTEEVFRLGGTAINEVIAYEGILDFKIPKISPYVAFKAFRTASDTFEGTAVLSDELWSDADRHCYITEHYELEMEGKSHTWFASKSPIKDANYLFVNLDVLDGGGNLMKRYRVSPFTGECRIMEGP